MDTDYPVGDKFLEYCTVLGSDFMAKMIIDEFSSFVWTERYRGYGDFELTMPVNEDIVALVNLDDYLTIKESDALMVIETMVLNTDTDSGADTITLSGRSVECLLERRIIWGEFKDGTSKEPANLQNGIKKMLDQNAISPSNEDRKLTGLSFLASTDDRVTALTSVFDFYGDNLYEAIDDLCSANQLGFRMRPLTEGDMTFELYFGEDRSWAQDKNSPVVFSNSYENLLTSDFVQSEAEYASDALVKGRAGQDEYVMSIYRKPERTGLKRREIYLEVSVDASDDESSDSSITGLMFEQAKKSMSEHNVTVAFGSDVEPMMQFQYGRDYFIGDIVQVENRYGFEGRCRIDEVVRSRDAAGPVLTPTFVGVNDDNEEVTS